MSNGFFLFHFFSHFLAAQPDQLPTDYDQDVVCGPLVNVDGTPMFSDAFDVSGKPYGDCGSSLSDNHVMVDVGSQSAFGSDF